MARGLAEQLSERTEAPRRQRLEKAQQDGQIRADIDVAAAVEALYAPLYYRLLLRTAPLSVDHVHAVIDATLQGLQPTPTRHP